MKNKKKHTPEQLLAIIIRMVTYLNCEGKEQEGCLGCGAYPESSENNIIVHEEGCDWVDLVNSIEEATEK